MIAALVGASGKAQLETSVPAASLGAPAAAEELTEANRGQLGLAVNIRPLPAPSAAASDGARLLARLTARIYEIKPMRCRVRGGSMELIAFITGRSVIVVDSAFARMMTWSPRS